ncbi:hypothetical protein V6N13_081058 [Hibiscus sabdariffa]|uniref:Uncharacterized protein n=1 Tax=Hibiscus sabdariffa TaxID=183260 RepID=A0ABR2DCA3_9ROSI
MSRMLLAELVPGSLANVNKSIGSPCMMHDQGIDPGSTAVPKDREPYQPPRNDRQVVVLNDTDAGGVKSDDPRKVVAPVPAAPIVLHEGADSHMAAPPIPSHRRKSLPPTEGSKVDADETARSNKRSQYIKHRPSSSTKRYLSGNDLVDATTEKDMGLDMAEAIEQPRPVH